ncbi:MAG TPA: hypothetical protein VFU71_17695 [Burkholderiaceae bacterium]|nr:hypothetical protein [Burkholderiaceae bacterium]
MPRDVVGSPSGFEDSRPRMFSDRHRVTATDIDPTKLDAMTAVEPMSRLSDLAPSILAGSVRGRTVIDVNA